MPPRRSRIAWVTGAAGGIGEATAERLDADGFSVVLIDSRKPELERTAERIGGTALHLDLAQTETIAPAAERLLAATGVPDVLVNNAGIVRISPVLEIDREDWARTLAVNLTAAATLTQVVLGPLIARGAGGRVVCIASTGAIRVNAGQAAYAASKAGLIAFTKAVAIEAAPHGITANVVCPGLTRSEMTLKVWGGEDGLAKAATTPSVRNPMGVVLDGTDIAHVVSFLADPRSRYITGQTIHCNAGSYMP